MNLCKFIKCLQLHAKKKWKFEWLYTRSNIKLLRKSSNSPRFFPSNIINKLHEKERHRSKLGVGANIFDFIPYHVLTQRQFFFCLDFSYKTRTLTHKSRWFLQCNKRWIDSRKISITEIIFIFFFVSCFIRLLPHNFECLAHSQLWYAFLV